MLKELEKKDKFVSWIVSNCQTVSRREDLVRSLQKHIPVDVYGQCGNLTCKTKDIFKSYECVKSYKFYLSFENALCEDYVTEKLFKMMFSYTLPVVYNGEGLEQLSS
jgi:alpha-1,3-fucosyltransferase